MALRLNAGRPPFVPVKLGRDAWIRLRAATASEVDDAFAEVSRQVTALALGGEIAKQFAALVPDVDVDGLAAMYADEIEGAEAAARLSLGLRSKIERIGERLALVALMVRCNDGWTGVLDSEEKPFPEKPDAGMVALLIQDATIRAKCHAAVFAAVHDEIDEKKGSAALPSGAAGAAAGSAPNADRSDLPAPAAGAEG